MGSLNRSWKRCGKSRCRHYHQDRGWHVLIGSRMGGSREELLRQELEAKEAWEKTKSQMEELEELARVSCVANSHWCRDRY